jgi:hypothetical protein
VFTAGHLVPPIHLVVPRGRELLGPVDNPGIRVSGFGFRVYLILVAGSGFRVFGLRVWGLGFGGLNMGNGRAASRV